MVFPNSIKAHFSAIMLITVLLFVFEQWRGTLLVKALSILFGLGFALRLCVHSLQFGINRKVFGSEDDRLFLPDLTLRKAVAYFRSFSETGEDRLMFAITCYAVAISLAAIITNPWWLAISLFLLSFTSVHSIRRTWPGFTLVLGSSQDPSFRGLLYLVMRSTLPFNTATMVNFPRAGEAEADLDLVLKDRIRNMVVSWQAAVEAHASLAKLIVVSLDDLRDAVATELQLLDRKRFWYKTILFSHSSPEDILAPIPLQVAPALSGALVTSDLSKVQSAIRSVTRGGGSALPSPENPISTRRPSGDALPRISR